MDGGRTRIKSWLSDYFGFAIDFRKNDEQGFPDDTDSPGPTIISAATLREISNWFGLSLEEVRWRFRSNIEIDGVPPFWEDRLFGAPGTSVPFRLGDLLFEGINPCQRCVVPPRDPATGANDDTFVRRFAELRNRTLPKWSTRSRFDHFYRVAINTRLHGNLGGEVCVGDAVHILETPGQRPEDTHILVKNEPADYWNGDLVVHEVRDETPTVKTFRLRESSGSTIPFRFSAGQFLTLTVKDGLKPVQRCYTIASSPADREFLEITIKREGLVSGIVHEKLSVGSLVAVSGPLGSFTFDGSVDREVVFIAGGVGITPLMSKIRFLSTQRWQGRIDLIYSVKTSQEIIFRKEIEHLKRRAFDLSAHLTVTGEDPAWTGPRGRMTADWIRSVIPDIAYRNVQLCGPTALASAAMKILRELGTPETQITLESFGGRSINEIAGDFGIDQPIRFAQSELSTLAPSGTSILDAALSTGVSIDYGCRAGVCGRCKVFLLEGEVASASDFVLSGEEKAAGMILACQSHALTPITIDS